MTPTHLLRILAVFAMLTCTPILLFGQAVNFAQIQGLITDPSGAMVPGATISATQTATGLVRTTTSNAEGHYALPNLPVGPYQLQVSAKGFRDYVQKGIALQVAENPTINIALQVGAVSETVEVGANTLLVQTHENSISTMIDNARIMELPLNGRNLVDLVMATGTTSDSPLPSQDLMSSKNYGNGTSGASKTLSVGGSQQNGNNFLLDGADHNDAFSNVNAPFPFPDAVQEFSVQSNGVSARYGVHAGATVNAITRSGTNRLHGTAFEFLRNPAVNAHHVQFKPPVAGSRDDTIRRNQFGGTLGGPIKKDKLMFFVGYQGTKQTSTPSATAAVVPTAAVLAGDFSTVMSDACQGLNKGKTLKSSYGFTANRIAPSQFNAQALALLKYVPVATDRCGNISFTVPSEWNEDQGVAKIDWNISSKHTFFTRYFATDYRNPVTLDLNNILAGSSVAPQFSRYQSLVFADTYSLSTNLVNSVHVTGTRTAINRGGTANMITPATVGINVPAPIPVGMVLSVANYFGIGGGSQMPGHFINNLYQVADDIDLVRGKHQLSFGVNFMKMQLNYLSTFQSNGQFTFGGKLTNDNLADFMLGLPSNFAQGNAEAENWRYTYIGLYLHDNIKLRSNLTLNAGVRWEPYLPSIDIMRRGSHFDLSNFINGVHSTVYPNAPAGLLYCHDAGIPCAFADSKLAQFSPRAGLIWDPRGKGRETIRLSYGMFYDSPEMYYFDRYADNSPFGSGVSFAPSAIGGLTNPYQGQTVPQFPLPFPQPGDPSAYFPKNGVYINNSTDVHPTYMQSWNLSFEEQFGTNWIVSASYVGSKTSHIWAAYEANPGMNVSVPANALSGCTPGQAPTTSNTNCRRSLYLLNPSQGQSFSNLTSLWDGANGIYNALLLSAQHRFAHNFTLLTNYTWSHCISDQDFSGELTNSRPTMMPSPITAPNFDNLRQDRGNCAFDIRQAVNASLVINSPKYQGLTGVMLNNWQFAPLVSYRTGRMFTVLTGVDTGLTGATTSFKDRPNLVGDPFQGTCPNGSPVGTRTCYFNYSAYVAPPTGTFGNAGRNSLAGPGAFNFDASISRKFIVNEGKELQLRLETFNVLNHPNLGNPNASLNSSNDGQILSQNGDGRTFQAAVKFSF